MLKKFRNKKTQKRIWIFLAIVIVPAFVLWGSSSMIHNEEENQFAGKIFGRAIPLLEFQEALEATKILALIQYGEKFEEKQGSLNLKAQAWERLILLAEAKAKKITVSDKEVVNYIRSYPFFQDKFAKFDDRIYAQMLQFVFHAQPRAFEEQTRQNLEISKLYRETTKDLKLSDKDIEQEYKKLNEEIVLTYIAGQPLDYLKEITTDDNELRAYFKENPLLFKRPLSFNLQYAWMDTKDKLTENKLKQLYWRLKLGQDFTKVAKDSGLTLKETGTFAENEAIPGIGWVPQATNLISKTRTGNYLKPLVLEDKYYIIKVKERKEPYIPDFENTKDKIKETYQKEKSKRIAKEKIDACLKKLKEAYAANPETVNFEAIAKETGLKSASTGSFKYGSYITGIGASDNFWAAAQELKEEETSGVISMPSGFYIIKLKSRTPIDEKKFASGKEAFRESQILERKQEKFTLFLEELKTKTQKY